MFKGAVVADKHGKTERDYALEFINRAERHGGTVPPWCFDYLDEPWLEPDLAYWWGLFASLHRSRSFGNGGPAPISYHDILSFGQLLGVDLGPFETEAITALDAVYLRAYADGRRRATEREGAD